MSQRHDQTDGEHEHHGAELRRDLARLADSFAQRRALLKWTLGLGALPLLACAATDESDASSDSEAVDPTDTSGSADTSGCTTIPEETAGPYPGDGTNGQNALALSGIIRSDIRSSIAGASGVAEGVALDITLTVVDGQGDCKPLAGYAVYLWHCDRAGDYSMYSEAAAAQNYLRGVQETDENGQVSFKTIFPGCYSGRWPHVHFEVFPSLDVASSGRNAVATSQLAFPEAECQKVYEAEGYEASVSNLAQLSLATDNIFSDGVAQQLAEVTGSVTAGLDATLTITI